MGKAGQLLLDRETEYTGLGALDPDDPGTIYLSTPIDRAAAPNWAHNRFFDGTSGMTVGAGGR